MGFETNESSDQALQTNHNDEKIIRSYTKKSIIRHRLSADDAEEDKKTNGVLKYQKNHSVPISILGKKSSRARTDRLGKKIEHNPEDFESNYNGSPPINRKRNTFHVTFKDKQEGGSLAKVIEVESYKKYNSTDPEIKL